MIFCLIIQIYRNVENDDKSKQNEKSLNSPTQSDKDKGMYFYMYILMYAIIDKSDKANLDRKNSTKLK